MAIEASNLQITSLAELANAWRASGAAAFSVSIGGATIGSWPLGVSIRQPDLAAPILQGGRPVGEIRIKGPSSHWARARIAADAELLAELIETGADLASMTDELIQLQDQLLAVYDLAQLTRRHVGVAETSAALAEAGARLLEVEGTAVVLAYPGRVPVAVQYPEDRQEQAWLVRLLPILKAQREAVLWQGNGLPESLPGDLRSVLMLPINIGGQIQSGLVFWSKRDKAFASPGIKLAWAIAEYAGAQIENALLHQDSVLQARLETEMSLARRVQMSLLPKTPPPLPGFQLYGCTRPASQVGGDYFDFIPGPHGSTAVLVGDVSGKGLSAALVMTMMRTVLRGVVRYAERAPDLGVAQRPAGLLARVNDELYEDLTSLSMFATLFAAQHHSGSRRLLYANAGHSPVVYMPARGPAELLTADGAPIGVLRTTSCSDRILELGPDDLLVVGSDGFNEAHNHAGEQFGIRRLLACLEANRHLPVEVLGQALFDAVGEYSGEEMQEDDQTLVIAKGASR